MPLHASIRADGKMHIAKINLLKCAPANVKVATTSSFSA